MTRREIETNRNGSLLSEFIDCFNFFFLAFWASWRFSFS